MQPPIIAFIGFGEAGPSIAQGLMQAGITDIRAYDILVDDPQMRDAWIAKAEATGARACKSAQEAVTDATFVFSTVTSKEAPKAARSAAAHMGQGQTFLDLNSCAPSKKVTGHSEVYREDGANYIDVAVMDTVPGKGHTVPMLLAGTGLEAAIERLAPYGMNMRVVGEKIGEASSIKMCRSVFMKGLEAIICESMTAAHRAGVHERVLASIQATFPDLDWNQLATYHMGRMAEHGKRRADEMESVADTLEDLGVEPLTTVSTGKRQRWISDLGMREHFAAGPPDSLETFLEAVEAQEKAKAQ